ncbi:hypothetical protein BGW37DRAFT_21487 [Umbelopsis sp. PMI_123]|nr:hypothetical protein BGW37DRAFT_21487 [Umbelopsis sp. PMI_123]
MLNSDDEDVDCPLCMEELDVADRNFKPCPCGYQVCRFCWHHIKENLNGRCPACRREYTEQSVEFQPVSPDEIARIKREKKEKEREQKEMELANRKHLANMRVIQKNLAYVIGLHPKYATEEIIRSNDFFGQYGKISKLVINKRPALPASNSSSTLPPSVGIYVTYQRKEDAMKCIQAVDGSMVGGRILRASLGTTKYCTYYLRNVPCPNPACMYLHEPGDDADSISKEELASGKHKMRDSMSSEFGPRSHAFDNRSFSSADNSPISSPSIHHSYKPLSTVESSGNISYKTPNTRIELYKQSYFDDQQASEPSRPALPLTASWAKSSSGSSTPTFRHQPNQDLDVTSDNFGPSLAAAVALAQKANNHSFKTKSDRKVAKKAERNAEQHTAKSSRGQPFQQEADVDTDFTDDDDGTSEPESSPKITDPLVYFVLGMDATDMTVPHTNAESEFRTLGVSSLHEDATVPEIKQDIQEEQTVVTGIAFLKSNIRYNTANVQPTFDPWAQQAIAQSPGSKKENSARDITQGTAQRPQWREQATLHDVGEMASPSISKATAHFQGSNISSKQTLPDMSPRSAALLSALQSNAEQQTSRSGHLNAPPGISRQHRSIPSDVPSSQPRVLSPSSTFSPLAVLNGANIPPPSPRHQHMPPNLPLSQDMHDVPHHTPAVHDLRNVSMLRQRSPQQTAQLLSQLTAPMTEQSLSSSTTGNMETRAESRRLRVFQGMRGDNEGLDNSTQLQSKKQEAPADIADYLNSMAVSPSFSIREPPRMQQANSNNIGAGSDMASNTQFARWGNLQLLSHAHATDKSNTPITTTPPGLVSTASSPKSSPYGPETPRFAGDIRLSPISLETLMSSAANPKGNAEPSLMSLTNNEYSNMTFKSTDREMQSANEEAAQLQDRLRALIHKNKNVMFS